MALSIGQDKGARRAAVQTIVWQVAVGVLLIALWYAAGLKFGTTWISSPGAVAARLTLWVTGDLWIHVTTTLGEMLIGMVIGTVLGVLAGLSLGRSPVGALVFRPIMVAIYSVPLIALAPLFVMLFGLDMLSKIVLVSIVVFFLIFFNTFSGVQEIDADLVRSLELMGATRTELFRKMVAPACMAWILGGVRIALPYALVAATTGEMLAARRGVGFLLSEASSQFDMASLYAAIFVLMLLGILIAEITNRLERHLLRWRHASG